MLVYNFPAILRQTLDERGLSQRWLAEKADITEGSISRYINGDREPKLDALCRIGDVLHMSIHDLCYSEQTVDDGIDSLTALVPEEDRVCIYCRYVDTDGTNDEDTICSRCKNFSPENKDKENWYEAEESFVRACYADCENCRYKGETACKMCQRNPLFSDNWNPKV